MQAARGTDKSGLEREGLGGGGDRAGLQSARVTRFWAIDRRSALLAPYADRDADVSIFY